MVNLTGYPYAGYYFSRPAGRLHYLDEGSADAPAVVCVHGNPTWSFFFRDLVPALRPHHRVIVPDHLGMGRSDRPEESRYDYRLKSRIDDLEALLAHTVPTGRVSLVVHDWGGLIGLGWATRHPHRIDRLVILNTAAFPLPAGKQLPWQLWLVRHTFLGSLLVRGFNAFVRGLVSFCSVRRLAPAVRAGYLAPYRTWRDRLAVLRFVQDIPLQPGDPSFAEMTRIAEALPSLADKPMLIGWGLRDFVFDADFLAEWRRRFPRATVLELADAAHLVLEDAGEQLLPHIVAHLSECPEGRFEATEMLAQEARHER
ncbi:MAG: alpha/beta fold hydrolase [Gemmataceae bacterium]